MDRFVAEYLRSLKSQLNQAKKTRDIKNQLFFSRLLGEAYEIAEDYRESLNFYKQTDDIAANLNKNRVRVQIFLGMVRDYINLKSFKYASEVCQYGLNLCTDLGYTRERYELNTHMSTIYLSMGDMTNAKINLSAAIEGFRELGLMTRELNSIKKMSYLYNSSGRNKEFKAQYEERMKLLRYNMSIINNAERDAKVALYHMNKGDVQISKDITNRVCKRIEELGDTNALATFSSMFAIACDSMKDYQNAIKYMKNTVIIYEKTGDTKLLPFAYINLGSFYWNIGDKEEAMRNIKIGFDWYDEIGSRPDETTDLTLIQMFGTSNPEEIFH